MPTSRAANPGSPANAPRGVGAAGGGRYGEGVGGSGLFPSKSVTKASASAGESVILELTPEMEEYARRLRAAGLLLDSSGNLLA